MTRRSGFFNATGYHPGSRTHLTVAPQSATIVASLFGLAGFARRRWFRAPTAPSLHVTLGARAVPWQ
jgi:hypothetical protein